MTANSSFGDHLLGQQWDIRNTVHKWPEVTPCGHYENVIYGWLRNSGASLQCVKCNATADFPVMWKIPLRTNGSFSYTRRMKLPDPIQEMWNNLNINKIAVTKWQNDITNFYNETRITKRLFDDLTTKWTTGT